MSLLKRIRFVRNRRSEKIKTILLKKLEMARQILVDEYHAKKIILFGSLLYEKKVHPFSDIDLIVEGLGENYLKAGGRLIDALGECIDLKPIEMLDEDLKKQVLQDGKVIYSDEDKD